MSYIRTLGAFIYSSIVSILFFIGSVFLYARILVYASGVWITLWCILGMVLLLGWISERGVQICSIPFNFLWDKTFKTRIATIVPPVVVGLWCVSAPFRIPMHFSVGDWILSAVWILCNLVFYYNLVTLPLINPDMGAKTAEHGQLNRRSNKMKSDNYKWLTSCITIAGIAIFAIIKFAPNNKAEHINDNTEVGEYIYVDDFYTIIHASRECPRLNYKGMTSRRINVDDMYFYFRNTPIKDITFCPKCVNDKVYKEITNAFSEQIEKAVDEIINPVY